MRPTSAKIDSVIFHGSLGHVLGQANLGESYEKGTGVARNDAEALVWYRKAADQGLVGAQDALRRMVAAGDALYRPAVHLNLPRREATCRSILQDAFGPRSAITPTTGTPRTQSFAVQISRGSRSVCENIPGTVVRNTQRLTPLVVERTRSP